MNVDVFGNLTDWGPVFDQLAGLRLVETLHGASPPVFQVVVEKIEPDAIEVKA